jgi:stearoyl-CoA desaturase (delta-9 desaturase)
LASYERTLRALILGRREMSEVVSDLDFPVSWVNRGGRWWLPHALHLAIALGLSWVSGAWYLGPAYWLGMMSHPVQGWMVNSLAHRYGYRNFDSADQSRNNSVVAWLVMGEGYQNNHHADPASARFSVRWFELDGGYALCWLAARVGMLSLPARRISAPALIPAES